ncbi:jg16739 [Pararge aegeria aegeria]|uniref:Jg16739 protein n=1 Tax=Pararge aegeria aegeria TaxID=348720 RepID=A0A8S4S6J1_9NEOP|nr:jg16739 [Pararge aegeria aegeria]
MDINPELRYLLSVVLVADDVRRRIQTSICIPTQTKMPCCKVTISKNRNCDMKCDKVGCFCIPTDGKTCICVFLDAKDNIVRCDNYGNIKRCDDCKCTDAPKDCKSSGCVCIKTGGAKCICVCWDGKDGFKLCDDCTCSNDGEVQREQDGACRQSSTHGKCC